MNTSAVADRIEADLRTIGRPERAIQEKRYLKSDLEFLGADYWAIGRHVASVARELRDLDRDMLVRLVESLWSKPIFDRRAAAVMLLERLAPRLGVGDLPLIERLVRESRTWALVDGLATDVVGAILAADPERVTPVMDRWSADEDFWVRRASLLAELRPIRGVSVDSGLGGLKRCSRSRSSSFARRSAGSCARRQAPAAGGLRLARAADSPRLGGHVRETVKYIAPEHASTLTDAHRRRRPAI